MDRTKPSTLATYAATGIATIAIVAFAGWVGLAIVAAIEPILNR